MAEGVFECARVCGIVRVTDDKVHSVCGAEGMVERCGFALVFLSEKADVFFWVRADEMVNNSACRIFAAVVDDADFEFVFWVGEFDERGEGVGD